MDSGDVSGLCLRVVPGGAIPPGAPVCFHTIAAKVGGKKVLFGSVGLPTYHTRVGTVFA